MAFVIIAQVIIMTAFTLGAVGMSLCEEKKEDVLTPLRRHVQQLEDELEEMRTDFRALLASQKEEIQELTRAFMAATQLASRERMEQKERLDALGRTIDGVFLRCASLEQRVDSHLGILEKTIASVEEKIPRPTRNLSIPLDDIPLYWRSPTDGPRGRPGRFVGPTNLKNLTSPRLVLEWALLPVGMPSSPIPEALQIKETITAKRLDRIIPAGQRAILQKAEIWHSTSGIVGNLDCTGSLQKYFDV